MMNVGDRIEFSFWSAGCLIWMADKDLGGMSYEEIASLIQGEEPEKAKQAIFQDKVYMAMDLYQDDGYSVRVVMGDLNQQENEEWVARTRWQLNLTSGKMLISGVLDSEEEILDEVPSANDLATTLKDEGYLECYVEVPPAVYQVEVYSYAPSDLSTGWEQIIGDQDSWCKPSPGIERESLSKYFYRTRPDETPPAWIAYEIAVETRVRDQARLKELYQAASSIEYVEFIIRLSPILEDIAQPEFSNGCLQWEFRKPERCPLGIPRFT